MSETPLTQQMIDTPVHNRHEQKGLRAAASRHPLVTGGLVLAGAGLAYAVVRLVMASQSENIARDNHRETTWAGGKGATEKASSDQPNRRWFEKAKTGAVAVTGNVEQGPPQQHDSPRDDRNKPASAIASNEAGTQGGSQRPEGTTRAA